VWDGQHIVVTYARQQALWARRYDRNLNSVGDAVRVTARADPAVTDHKHIFLNGMHFVAYSTPGDAELYLLKLDSDLNRLGFVPVVEGTTRERTNDMLLGTDGQRLLVGRFCPCKEAGIGHVFTVFDQNLIRVGSEVDLLEPRHTNMASITFADGAYHILSFRRLRVSDQSSPSSLLQLDVDPVTLAALGQGNIVKRHDTEFYHASTGLVYDSTRQVYYGSYIRGSNMWGAGAVVVEVFDAHNWESLASIDVAEGNRPHLALVDADTLVVGWDEPGVNLGVITLSTTTVPTSTPTPVKSADATIPTGAQCEAGASNGKLPANLDSQGPYYHQIYRAFSSDGLTFVPENALLLDHASVPDATLRPNGEVWVYFVNGVPGKHGIWVAKSSTSGAWDIVDCVRLDGSFNANAVDPDIVLLSDGRYRLFYYEGHFVGSRPPSEGPHPIFSAISEDGLNFKIERQLIAVETVTDPSVVQLANGRWLMALSQGTRTLLADSDDGYDFELTGVVVELGGVPELAILADGNVRLYVTAGGIKSVVSGDEGQTWVVEPGTRLSSPQGEILADPSLITTSDGTWVLFYKMAPPPSPPQSG
jgi:hypothetical protein